MNSRGSSAIILVLVLSLAGCSGDRVEEPAAAEPSVEEVDTSKEADTAAEPKTAEEEEALAFVDEEEVAVPDAPAAVSVADVLRNVGASEELALCYSTAYGQAGLDEITSHAELRAVEVTPELQKALNKCVDLANGG